MFDLRQSWIWGFPGGSDSEESACNAGNPDLIPGLERFPGEENGYQLQYCCLENSIDRGGWQVTLSLSHTHTHTHTHTHAAGIWPEV